MLSALILKKERPMNINSKKIERTSNLLYWFISVILCIFLILLADNIIGDIDDFSNAPKMQDFETSEIKSIDNKDVEMEKQIGQFDIQLNTLSNTIHTAEENYKSEKQSFDNWVKTRKTLGAPDKDQEVVSRAKSLDEFYKIEQAWRNKYNDLLAKKTDLIFKREVLYQQRNQLNEAVEIKYNQAYTAFELKIFLYRLLFVGPILALGIYLFLRYRKHAYWPLFMGFSLFSVYAFFFGLVPYLPSYGGYVRYAVGILLSLGLGYYAIKKIRSYLAQKQEELKISTEERAKKVETAVAEKALDNHCCPSCGKDFLLKRWELPLNSNFQETIQSITDFCRHCGLKLFSNCKKCGQKNFAHLPYCSGCGQENISEKDNN